MMFQTVDALQNRLARKDVALGWREGFGLFEQIEIDADGIGAGFRAMQGIGEGSEAADFCEDVAGGGGGKNLTCRRWSRACGPWRDGG